MTTKKIDVKLGNPPSRGGLPKLMGVTEVCDMLETTSGNLDRLSGLPAPVVTYLKGGRLWLADDVKEFAKIRRANRAKAEAAVRRERKRKADRDRRAKKKVERETAAA